MLTGVVINEIHFDPDDSTEHVEFIELYNDNTTSVDLSGWVLDKAVDYEFASGFTLAAGGYAVVTQDVADFQAKFGFAPTGQWETGDRLKNSGEEIKLRNSAGDVIDEVEYQLGFPWPLVGEYGNSIELIHPSLDNNLGGNWRSSGNVDAVNPMLLTKQATDWRYRKGLSEPPVNWQSPGFNEASDSEAWQTGQTSIGYGDFDDNTFLADMRDVGQGSGFYSTVYLRNEFTIAGDVPDDLLLRLYVDDGAIIYINGNEVTRAHVSGGFKPYNGHAFSHDAVWEDVFLTNTASYLNTGVNTIAIHALNTTDASSDFSIDAELLLVPTAAGAPTPGDQNTVFSLNAAPQMRQLSQSVQQPTSGQEVTITMKVTDPDGVQNVTLDYQLVDPGNYIRLTDAAYQTSWTTLVMHDDGLNGDAVAGDDVYSVTLAGSLQTHRRLVRYRVTSTDNLGVSIRGPYADDLQPNFAYFVYDSVPDYTGALRPGFTPNVNYSGDVLDNIATYQLIADSQDIQNSQYNSSFNEVLFNGTFVYDGVVYDHVDFRNRGSASTYHVGKNKWKIEFLRGHHFQGRDNYGNLRDEKVDEINILPGSNPWWRNDVATAGTVLFEPAAFKLYELAGTPAPNTNYFQFRVIDSSAEAGREQYGGDFWGLYINIEQPDGHFLDEHGLADGNIFNMHESAFGTTTQRSQGSELPSDRSDLVAFLDGIDGGFETLQWWEENLNWDSYFAWNIINHAANNSDVRPDGNVNYYHNQEDGKWYILPWDMDLSFEDAYHHNIPVTDRENIKTLMEDHPLARLAYNNRLREITDLLFNSSDAALVVEELANVLTFDGTDETIVSANQAQWDYHPQKNKKGIWYKNFNSSLLPSQTFDGLTQYMQDFLSPGGYGYNLMVGQGDDSQIPNTPTISNVGDPGFAVDSLVFQTSSFSDPQGAGTFANMEWRVAEVHNSSVVNFDTNSAYIYEIEGTWESGEISTFDNQITLPGNVAEVGKTYRARVRMQDSSGRWSHWSDSIEFLATDAVTLPTLSITELHYNPGLPNEGDQEFIEILNTGASTVDLSGVQIADFASAPYVFANGLSLASGEYIVVARTPAVFEAVYGTDINLAGSGFGTASLSNKGELISLLTASGVTIESFEYDDKAPWPEAADGDGPSLEIIDPLGDHTDPLNWQASVNNGGSPGNDGQQTILPGDYDGDGSVNGSDFLVWQRAFGTTVVPAGSGADGDLSGDVSAGDLTVWDNNYGTSTPPATSITSNLLSLTAIAHSNNAVVVQSTEEQKVSLLLMNNWIAVGMAWNPPLQNNVSSLENEFHLSHDIAFTNEYDSYTSASADFKLSAPTRLNQHDGEAQKIYSTLLEDGDSLLEETFNLALEELFDG